MDATKSASFQPQSMVLAHPVSLHEEKDLLVVFIIVGEMSQQNLCKNYSFSCRYFNALISNTGAMHVQFLL